MLQPRRGSPLPQITTAVSELTAVVATSARNAWAVGSDSKGTLVLHWHGTAWKRARVPALAVGSLYGVAERPEG
ncbi:MAG TPA: hypothetical protein VMU94_28975 [Streptosporangiaceae bacterium]|nr:hypothetical protein [Streptosporangiaceae bacterium]